MIHEIRRYLFLSLLLLKNTRNCVNYIALKFNTKEGNKLAEQKIRINLKSYDHRLIDNASDIIIETARRTGAKISGPVPLPTKKEIITILRSVHKHKDSREQFERRTHKRLIDILKPGKKTVESLTALTLPEGVDITLKIV